MVKSRLETLKIDVDKAYTVFQNAHFDCSCIDCQHIIRFLKDPNRHKYEYRQYWKQVHHDYLSMKMFDLSQF